jgi:hypothetical protein
MLWVDPLLTPFSGDEEQLDDTKNRPLYERLAEEVALPRLRQLYAHL